MFVVVSSKVSLNKKINEKGELKHVGYKGFPDDPRSVTRHETSMCRVTLSRGTTGSMENPLSPYDDSGRVSLLDGTPRTGLRRLNDPGGTPVRDPVLDVENRGLKGVNEVFQLSFT